MSDKKDFVPNEDDEYERKIYQQEKMKKLDEEKRQKALKDLEKQREEERRKQLARDRIELAKLKNGVIEESETIREEEKVERILTPKEKVANFFYHYKLPIIICTLTALALGYIIYDMLSRVKPDITIISTCNNGLEFRTKELANYFEQFCPDLNNDGKVKVQVISCPDTDNYQMRNTYNTQIMAQLQMDQTIIILTSDDFYDLEGEIDEEGHYVEGVYMFADVFANLELFYPDNESVDKKGYHLDGEKVAEALDWKDMPDNIVLSLRAPVKPLHGELEEMEKNFKINKKILEGIMTDNGDL